MTRRIPVLLPEDLNGRTISKFLDAFELVRFKVGGEPKYYGYLHPDSHFCIVCHATTGEGAGMDEHLTFYGGDIGETLAEVWPDVATLSYGEYDEVY